MNHSEAVSFIWGTADLLRDSFKRGKYQDVILPLTVLRRIDSVLAPTKAEVFAINQKYAGKIDNPDALLRKASGHAFYNTSRYDFERLVADPPNLAANLRNYIAGFSPNMREVIEKFDFDNTIDKLVGFGVLNDVELSRCVIGCTGRQARGMVSKIANAGVPIIVSKAAPTDKGIFTADEAGVTLICFARGERFTIYSHPHRVSGVLPSAD